MNDDLSAIGGDCPQLAQALKSGSRSLLAILHPETLAVEWATDAFHEYLGTEHHSLGNHLREADWAGLRQRYHLHVLYRLLAYCSPDPMPTWRLLDEPLMVMVSAPDSPASRYVQLWMRSDDLECDRVDLSGVVQEALGLDTVNASEYGHWLNDPERLAYLEERVEALHLPLSGYLMLEGLDVTSQEHIRRVTQLLVNQNSVLQPEKFERVNVDMCRLFRAETTAIVCFQQRKARLFMGNVSFGKGVGEGGCEGGEDQGDGCEDLSVAEYPFESLQGGQMMEAIAQQQVMVIPDLRERCVTELGDRLVQLGVRSVLLIPLMAEQVTAGHYTSHPIGLVGVLSQIPHQFDAVDRARAERLMPAFASAMTTALRQMHHQRFINSIHPSVEWRFIQEAERRSLGMLPEPIIFHDVFPLYGISDIRGSSDERNQAIQEDLLEQLRLGVAVVDAVSACRAGAFVSQMRLDLLNKIEELEQGVTVGAEVTVSHYLGDRLETHFDYFATCSPAAKAAVDAYRDACDTHQGSVYRARARYDFLLGQITTRLRATWEQWQHHMQQVIPHYCDVEVTDGIDHMIYAGGAIAANFSPFHLHSLRYEQLRAVCACAHTAFDIQTEFDSSLGVTHLVLVQDSTVDIFHDEDTERLFDVRGTRDTRYEIVKKRIDKAIDMNDHTRITQPGMLTVVYSTEQEEKEYREYLRYLNREGIVDAAIQSGNVEPLQGVSGLKFLRVTVLKQQKND